MGNGEAIPMRGREPPAAAPPAAEPQQQHVQQVQHQPSTSSPSTSHASANQWSNYRVKQGQFLEHLSDSDYKELRNMVFKCLAKNLLIFCGPFIAVAAGTEICGRLQLITLAPPIVRISGVVAIFVVIGAAAICSPMTKCGAEVKLHVGKLHDKYVGQLGENC